MRYRLGILSGLVIAGILALGLASGVVGSETVEAARPSVRVTTHSLYPASATLQGSCDFSIQVAWEGNAFAHKNGHYSLFLMSRQGDGPLGDVGKPELPRFIGPGSALLLPLLPDHLGLDRSSIRQNSPLDRGSRRTQGDVPANVGRAEGHRPEFAKVDRIVAVGDGESRPERVEA